MLILHPLSQCDICMRKFSDSVPPYAISCGHIFCHRCFGQAPIKRCALCRRPYTSRNIKKLHVDFALTTADSSTPNPEATILQKLAEWLVLGDDLASPELATAVEEADRWLSLSAKPWEFKGLRNIRELMEEYGFIHHEYYRLLNELDTAQVQLGFASTLPEVKLAAKPTSASLKTSGLEGSTEPSKFESLIDMLREDAWDADMRPPTSDPRSPRLRPASPVESLNDDDQAPFSYAIDDYQQIAPQGIASSRFTTGQRGMRVPTQYNRNPVALGRQVSQRVSEDQRHYPHDPNQVPEERDELETPPRVVRFSQTQEFQPEYPNFEEGAEDNEWEDAVTEPIQVFDDQHRHLTLQILERGSLSSSPQPLSYSPPPAPRFSTLSLSLSLSRAPSNSSGSRRLSQAVSVITVDSVQSDNSWGTQSSLFSHMPGLRSLSSMHPRSSASSTRSGMLLMPQLSVESLRRRRIYRPRSKPRSGSIDAIYEGNRYNGRRPRALPYFPFNGED